jgi:hypothetical protein
MGQAGATLGAAGGQDLSAGAAGHTFHEPVFAGALALLWLVSLFRHSYKVVLTMLTHKY